MRTDWEGLGIPSQVLADIIARVCLLAGNHAGHNFEALDSQTAVPEDTAANVQLLSACLALCKSLDLTSPSTPLQHSHISAYRNFFIEKMQKKNPECRHAQGE
jgi:hypothetical protein